VNIMTPQCYTSCTYLGFPITDYFRPYRAACGLLTVLQNDRLDEEAVKEKARVLMILTETIRDSCIECKKTCYK